MGLRNVTIKVNKEFRRSNQNYNPTALWFFEFINNIVNHKTFFKFLDKQETDSNVTKGYRYCLYIDLDEVNTYIHSNDDIYNKDLSNTKFDFEIIPLPIEFLTSDMGRLANENLYGNSIRRDELDSIRQDVQNNLSFRNKVFAYINPPFSNNIGRTSFTMFFINRNEFAEILFSVYKQGDEYTLGTEIIMSYSSSSTKKDYNMLEALYYNSYFTNRWNYIRLIDFFVETMVAAVSTNNLALFDDGIDELTVLDIENSGIIKNLKVLGGFKHYKVFVDSVPKLKEVLKIELMLFDYIDRNSDVGKYLTALLNPEERNELYRILYE